MKLNAIAVILLSTLCACGKPRTGTEIMTVSRYEFTDVFNGTELTITNSAEVIIINRWITNTLPKRVSEFKPASYPVASNKLKGIRGDGTSVNLLVSGGYVTPVKEAGEGLVDRITLLEWDGVQYYTGDCPRFMMHIPSRETTNGVPDAR